MFTLKTSFDFNLQRREMNAFDRLISEHVTDVDTVVLLLAGFF